MKIYDIFGVIAVVIIMLIMVVGMLMHDSYKDGLHKGRCVQACLPDKPYDIGASYNFCVCKNSNKVIDL